MLPTAAGQEREYQPPPGRRHCFERRIRRYGKRCPYQFSSLVEFPEHARLHNGGLSIMGGLSTRWKARSAYKGSLSRR